MSNPSISSTFGSGANAKTFGGSLQKFVDQCKGKEGAFLRQFAQDMLQVIVAGEDPELGEGIAPGTPVDTGFARASWYVGVNNPEIEHTVQENRINSETGEKEIVPWEGYLAESLIQLHSAKVGDTIYLMNNCKYIVQLEYGHSINQAPDGMVRPALARFQAIADATVARITKRS